jgi:hypothetical protein
MARSQSARSFRFARPGSQRLGDAGHPRSELNSTKTAWHSSALFINDNVATQIDGLAHITTGDDSHWYNGFKEADGAKVASAIATHNHPADHHAHPLIDVAARVDMPGHFKITPRFSRTPSISENRDSSGRQRLIRTARSASGARTAATTKIARATPPSTRRARWLVEEKGAS